MPFGISLCLFHFDICLSSVMFGIEHPGLVVICPEFGRGFVSGL